MGHGSPPRRRATLGSIAEAVGVSTATVSNAYNRPHKLSAALRERILAAAEELGYGGPDPAASGLRRGRAGSLGLLLGEALPYAFRDPGAIAFLAGLAEAAAAERASLQLVPALEVDPAADAALVAGAIVDGLVIWSLPDDHPLVAAALRRGLPLVTHGSPELPGIPFVGIDDRAAARAAAAHLAGLGHEHVGVISFPFGAVRRKARLLRARRPPRAAYRLTRERLAGYRAAGLPWPGAGVYETEVNARAQGSLAAHALLAASPRPTALLAMSDELALGALDAARELGLAVPEQLSLVGWDDMPAAQAAGLTTIHQSLEDQGRTCARLLLSAEPQAERHLAPWRLVVRGSTAAPPSQVEASIP